MMVAPPAVQILTAMQLRGEGADYTQAGIVAPVTVRHSRNRNPVRSSRPAVTLILVSDEPQGEGDTGQNMDETVWQMVVDVQVDLHLDAEDSGADPTGVMRLLLVTAVFVRALRDPYPSNWLGGMVDWIRLGALEPEDRSTPDDGRMTRALTVLYRTRSDDENVLLGAGVNG